MAPMAPLWKRAQIGMSEYVGRHRLGVVAELGDGIRPRSQTPRILVLDALRGCVRHPTTNALLLVEEPHLSVRRAAAGVLGLEDGHVGVEVVVDDDVSLAFVSAQRSSDCLNEQAGVGDRADEEDGVDDGGVEAFTAVGDGRHDQERVCRTGVRDAFPDRGECFRARAAAHDQRMGIG